MVKTDGLKKVIIVIFSVIMVVESLLLHCTSTVLADDDFTQYELYLYSNVVDIQPITVFEKDGDYYIEVSELADLTRCSFSDRPSYCYLTQGIWTVTLDFHRQLLEDSTQESNIVLYQVNEMKLVPAVELLYYFGATYVNIDLKDHKFYCVMPNYTAWEALNVDYGLSLSSIYSNKDLENIARVFDVMNEYIMGDGTTPEGYRKRAYDEVSQIDMLSVSGVKEYISRIEEENSMFLDSKRGVAITEKIDNDGLKYIEEERLVDIISDADTENVSEEELDEAKSILDNGGLLNKGSLALARYLYSNQSNWLREAIGEKYTKSFKNYSNDAMEGVLKKVEKETNVADWSFAVVSTLVNTANTSIAEMKSVQNSNNLVADVMGRDDWQHLGIEPDASWIKTAKKYKTNTDIITSNLVQYTIEQAISQLNDKGLDVLFKEAGVAAQIGLVAGRKLMEKIPSSGSGYKESRADLSAIMLCDLQEELLKIIAKYYENIDFTNEEDIEKLINASAMYCRTTIAMYQELFAANGNKTKKQALYQEKIDSAAISLYKIMTFAEDGIDVVIPRNYSELKEKIDNTKDIWLITTKTQSPTDVEVLADLYNKTIADYDKMMNERKIFFNDPDRYTYYAIVDIDSNGVDELILRYDFENQDHSTSVDDGYAETTAIYTIIDGEVVEILPANTREGIYVPTFVHEGYIRIYKGTNMINRGFSREPRDDDFYLYQDGVLSETPEVTMTHGDGSWIINGENKTQEECELLLFRLCNGGEGYELQPYEKPEQLEDDSINSSEETIVVAGGYVAPKSDFIFWFSSERAIDISELDKMTPTGMKDVDIASMSEADKQIRLNTSQVAIDEIYARHGMTVADTNNPSPADLYAREYFNSLEWYRKANTYFLAGNKTELNDIEKNNISLLYHWQHQYWHEDGYVSPYEAFRVDENKIKDNNNDGENKDLYNYRKVNVWDLAEMIGGMNQGDGDGIIFGSSNPDICIAAFSDGTDTNYIAIFERCEYTFGGIRVGDSRYLAEENILSLGFELDEDGMQKFGNPWKSYIKGREEISYHWDSSNNITDIAWNERRE